jgi:predicted HD superfamily hydrolase involved in NAD metabolism
MSREGILAYLKASLKPRRVEHSLGVEKTARELALRYGCNADKAALAGLAHDCGKSLPQDVMASYAAEAGFPAEGLGGAGAGILHAPAGAIVAMKELGIEDSDVLSAICWHTVPRPDMSMLDKIVSLADIIEPNRDFDGVERIRAEAKRDLDEAFRLSMARVMRHVLDDGLFLHPQTLQVYNELTLAKQALMPPSPAPSPAGKGK